MKGKAYMGFRRANPKTTKRIVKDVPREGRKMEPVCNSRKCQESKKRGFEVFLLDFGSHCWDLKNIFVCSTVDIKSTKRKTTKGDDERWKGESLPETENVFAFPCLYTSRPAITHDK
ncbi:hypothetical protein AVEN_239482-1 [Araneus ventricosus]|uniref:Uncharacterized protein n=1 Tax=Araneus ventricosus TaxID=182803 RepID=A0A4Y2N5K7_ARAVE|nr:hypothetical protein AVEN_239482-1 [Araneus ventricosus]